MKNIKKHSRLIFIILFLLIFVSIYALYISNKTNKNIDSDNSYNNGENINNSEKIDIDDDFKADGNESLINENFDETKLEKITDEILINNLRSKVKLIFGSSDYTDKDLIVTNWCYINESAILENKTSEITKSNSAILKLFDKWKKVTVDFDKINVPEIAKSYIEESIKNNYEVELDGTLVQSILSETYGDTLENGKLFPDFVYDEINNKYYRVGAISCGINPNRTVLYISNYTKNDDKVYIYLNAGYIKIDETDGQGTYVDQATIEIYNDIIPYKFINKDWSEISNNMVLYKKDVVSDWNYDTSISDYINSKNYNDFQLYILEFQMDKNNNYYFVKTIKK